MYDTIKSALALIAPTYDPGVQVGEVKAPYLVLHDMGVNPNAAAGGLLGQHIYEIVLLAPLNRQRELKEMSVKVRKALESIKGLKYTGDAAPTGIEAPYRGASISLVYRMPQRLDIK